MVYYKCGQLLSQIIHLNGLFIDGNEYQSSTCLQNKVSLGKYLCIPYHNPEEMDNTRLEWLYTHPNFT